jgi:hypothetical protein
MLDVNYVDAQDHQSAGVTGELTLYDILRAVPWRTCVPCIFDQGAWSVGLIDPYEGVRGWITMEWRCI